MLEILKKKRKQYKYKYRIIFINRNESVGTLRANSLDEVYNLLCKDKFTQTDNNTKAFYWNANEINTIEVEKIEENR